jgi:hypothetical protein
VAADVRKWEKKMKVGVEGDQRQLKLASYLSNVGEPNRPTVSILFVSTGVDINEVIRKHASLSHLREAIKRIYSGAKHQAHFEARTAGQMSPGRRAPHPWFTYAEKASNEGCERRIQL